MELAVRFLPFDPLIPDLGAMTDSSPAYQQFFAELKRRRVFRVMAVYGIIGFGIIEAAEAIFPRVALPDWAVTLVVWLTLLGFPIAVLLAWAFDSTPEGVKRTADATPEEISEILAQPAAKRWVPGLFAVAGVALLFGGWWVGRQTATTDGTADAVEASIAVLPFADMSPNKDQEYFSDGISEELLNLLARIPELHVAARTSSFSFKDQNLEITEIADRLNVAHVLEGSVRKADNEVRITAQLIRADDGFHLWSQTWDRTLDDIFAIQEEIAADVVEQLQVRLLGAAPTVQKTDPAAYALYLQARHLSRMRTAGSVEGSNALYQQALEIDPDYAEPWAGLAENYGYQGVMVLLPIDEGFRLAREAVNRALEIDPDNVEAYAALAAIASVYDNDLAAAAQHVERALELDPTNLDILTRASRLAQNLGRLDEAVALGEYVVSRDPVNPRAHSGLGYAYNNAQRLDEALTSFGTALSLSPGRIGVQSGIGLALLHKGEPEAALAAFQQEPSEALRMIGLPLAYHALSQATESDATLAELIDRYEQDWAYNIASVLAFRGEADQAFEWLDKAVEYNYPSLRYIPVESLFANIHDDPRWLPFLESIGKSPKQLAAIEFEVQLPQ